MKWLKKIWTKIVTRMKWFSGLGSAFITEVQDRVLMSPKRLIKFLGIALVPIIYGVICLVAFWNPVSSIGKAPMAVFNQDHKVILVKQISATGMKIGALTNANGEVFGNDENDDLEVIVKDSKEGVYKNLNSKAKGGKGSNETFDYVAETTTIEITSMWDIMKSMFLPKTDDSIADTDYTFQTAEIADGMAITNMKYIDDQETIDKQWQNSKYYVQVKIENGYAANLLGLIGTALNQEDSSSFGSEIKPIQIWTTFERNYLFGYYMNTFSNFASGMILEALPSILLDTLTGNLFKDIAIDGETLNNETKGGFEEDQSYITLRSGDMALKGSRSDQQSLDNLTLFGNINADGSAKGMPANGILSKTYKEIFANISGLQDLIKLLGNTKVGSQISAIIDILKDLTDAKDPSKIDDGKVDDFNGAIYKVMTGQVPAGFKLELLDPLLKALNISLTENILPELAIYPSDSPGFKEGYMDQEQFSQIISQNMAKHPDIFLGTTSIPTFISSLFESKLLDIAGGVGIDDLINIEIRGAENGLYGIGLGEFFIVIGIWVGILMQTFIYDRAKRKKTSTRLQWYFSKTLLMLATTLIQVTLQIWIAYACGWYQLGGETMVFVWLWLLVSSSMFVIIIQTMWFLVKDEAVGKFLVVIIMVLSLAAGGGTFPAFAQFKFFEVISYVVPFTYVLRGMGAIIFGMPELGINSVTTNVVFDNLWPIILFAVVFLAIGVLIGSRNRHKEILFGSFSGKHVAAGMKALNDKRLAEFAVEKNNKNNKKTRMKYNWKQLGQEQDLVLYRKVKEMYPFEGTFKWWKNKNHDFVAKPNETDDDVISRNE